MENRENTPYRDRIIRPRGGLFHGTSEFVVNQIRNRTNIVIPAYTHSNISLGGAYLTAKWEIASIAAMNAARKHDSTPVILSVITKKQLLPDEDWVVPVAERPSDRDFDWETETYKKRRYQEFFADLFSEYIGDGHSLSDEYARRYSLLNEKHSITWKDSFRAIQSVRQDSLLSVDQVLRIHSPYDHP